MLTKMFRKEKKNEKLAHKDSFVLELERELSS